MINAATYRIVIENPKGSYKSFEIEGDPVWKSYPLVGVTYPVDYGFIQGYQGEDGAELDVFVGTGDKNGALTIWRLDVPVETKFFMGLTDEELGAVLMVFKPVLLTASVYDDDRFMRELEVFKRA